MFVAVVEIEVEVVVVPPKDVVVVISDDPLPSHSMVCVFFLGVGHMLNNPYLHSQ